MQGSHVRTGSLSHRIRRFFPLPPYSREDTTVSNASFPVLHAQGTKYHVHALAGKQIEEFNDALCLYYQRHCRIPVSCPPPDQATGPRCPFLRHSRSRTLRTTCHPLKLVLDPRLTTGRSGRPREAAQTTRPTASTGHVLASAPPTPSSCWTSAVKAAASVTSMLRRSRRTRAADECSQCWATQQAHALTSSRVRYARRMFASSRAARSVRTCRYE